MHDSPEVWNDRRIEVIVGNLLRGGVLLAGAVVVVGGAIFLMRHGRETPHYHQFVGEPAALRTVPGILREAASLRGREIIQLGLLILIATPIIRVAFSVVGFALERDYFYVGVTLIVLAVLLFSLAGGHL
jgi:uncharacterized membrane protein